MRPPRATATSTINTVINGNPRMSLGVTTAPTAFKPPASHFQTNPLGDHLHKDIGSMEYDYNKQYFISSSLDSLQDQNTNPSITRPVQNYNSLATYSLAIANFLIYFNNFSALKFSSPMLFIFFNAFFAMT